MNAYPPPLNWSRCAQTPRQARYPSLRDGFVGGIAPCVFGGPSQQLDPGPGRLNTVYTTFANVIWPLSPLGFALGSSSTSVGQISFDGVSTVPTKFKLSPPCSFSMFLRWDGTALPGLPSIAGYVHLTDSRAVAVPPANGLVRGLAIIVDSGGAVYLAAGNGAANTYTTYGVSSTVLVANAWTSVVMTASGEPLGASTVRMWFNGTEDTGIGGGAGAVTATHVNNVPTVYNGSRRNFESSTGIDIGTCLTWKRALSEAEAILLSNDPLAWGRRRAGALRRPSGPDRRSR